jgi:hypothetical protein
MPDQVKVEDLEVFSLFRASMLKFAQAAAQSLSNADSQVARVHSWLDGEQRSFWQSQLRKRVEAVASARDALRQKKLYKDSAGRTPSAAQEEKTLSRCIAAVDQAENKLQAIRKWLPRLEKAADQYRGGVSRLCQALSGDIPKAVALLDRLSASLEHYVQIESTSGSPPALEASSAFDAAMSRAGDADAEEPSHALETSLGAADDLQPAVPPATPGPTSPPAENPDVPQ